MKLARKRVAVATVGVAVCGAVAAAALASPPSGFAPTNLVAEAERPAPIDVDSDGVKLQTTDPVDVRVQLVKFGPGGRSGWHHHPGIVIVAIKTGTLTVLDENCNATTYGKGSPNGSVFIEAGDAPGEVRNNTGKPARVYATFIAPDADPGVFRIEDTPPDCAA